MNHHQICRYRTQAGKMKIEAEVAMSAIFRAEEKIENMQFSEGRIIDNNDINSVEEIMSLISTDDNNFKLRYKYKPDFFIRKYQEFIESDGEKEINGLPFNVAIQIIISQMVEYFRILSKENDEPTEEEIIDFIEISYLTHKAIKLAMVHVIALDKSRKSYIKSTNKSVTTRGKNEKLLIETLKQNRELFTTSPKGNKKKPSLNNICENVCYLIRTRHPEETQTTATVKSWFKKYLGITPQNVDQLETRLDSL